MRSLSNRDNPNTETPAVEEKEKIERMNNIRQSLANTDDHSSDLPKSSRKSSSKTQLLDVSIEDKPPQIQGSEETRAQKVAQIREALAMVERTPQPPPPPVKKGGLPPLKKKGTKSTAAQRAAAETIVTPHRPAAQTPPPVQKQTKSAAKPAPKANPQQARTTAPKSAQGGTAVKTAPPAVKQPLPPLKKSGTKGTAQKAAAETMVVTKPSVKGEASKDMKPKKAAPPPPAKVKAVPKKSSEHKPFGVFADSQISVGKLSAIVGASAVGVLVIAYVIVALLFSKKFLPNTYINDVPIGNMSLTEAESVLLDKVKADNLLLMTAQDEEVSFDAKDYEAYYSLPEGALDEAFAENRFLWLKKMFVDTNYKMEYDFNYSEEALRNLIVEYDWGNASSQDAYIQKKADGMYEIVPATIGNKFDKNKLMNYITEQLTVGNATISMLDSGCYDAFMANVQAEDLQQQLELCNKFAKCSITFDFSDRQEVLEGATIADWVYMTSSGELDFNRGEVEAFVAAMADKYDTYGRPRTFRSTLDGTITVPWTSTSIYGWQINQDATVEQIFELLEAGESATVEPVYHNWGYGYTRDTNDIGSTYIEIDISAQHVWYYKGGVLQMESDCVTGTETVSSRRTPRGIFQIWSHESPRKLGQMDDEGYEEWVDFWMPIDYTGVGLHDLKSRSAFGGSIYQYNGSHGCINLPYTFVKNLYNSTVNGIPVIVHD